MIVYHTVGREEATSTKLDILRSLARDRDTTSFLIEAGELEQALLDRAAPSGPDRWDEPTRCLRAAVVEAARAFLAQRSGGAPDAYLTGAFTLLRRLRTDGVPERITVIPPEGFAHFALDPEAYAVAAEAYRADAGEARAARAVVVGVRTIGTTLSAIVAAALDTPRTCTVRPRDRTGTRRIAADRSLAAAVSRWAEDGGDVLIVDEGPGVTGETLAVTFDWIRELGVPEGRIVLVPSRAWGLELAPPERRQWFERARKYAPPPEDARPRRLADALGLSNLQDLSAGHWRKVVPGAAREAAFVIRERVKHLGHRHGDGSRLIRYIGLARWGEALARRAARLAEAGLGPAPECLFDGFLVCEWVPGRIVSRETARRDAEFFAALERYLRGRAPLFPTGRPVSAAEVVATLIVNATDALGTNPAGLAAAARRIQALPEREAVIPDARLHAREWIESPAGYRKVDAIDHGDGIWFPGPTDRAWDLAAASIEFDLDPAALRRLIERCARAAGDDATVLADAVAAYRPVYAASSIAEATLAAREAPDGEDRRRLEREAGRYRGALVATLRQAA